MSQVDLPPTLRWLPALNDPALAAAWSLPEWDTVVRTARRLRLLARLAETLEAAGQLQAVPAPAQRLLRAEMQLSRWRTTITVWALQRVGAALADGGYPVVLLKGGAYLGQDLPIARGRLPSDLDILVPHRHLAAAQRRLADWGWEETPMDEHDQRYYREWSHEVPPMQHPVHPVELDLHHNILPPVARTNVDADRLLQRLRPSRWAPWSVFDPADQMLHSASHLFLDAEPRDRVRDLVDLDGLARHFGQRDGQINDNFWAGLADRSRELGLQEPLAQAVHFMQRWFDTPMPEAFVRQVQHAGPGTLRRAWLHPLMARVLTPTHPDTLPPWTQDFAATVVLARYHRNRLPLHLLLPHLWRKWRMRQRAEADPAAPAPEAP